MFSENDIPARARIIASYNPACSLAYQQRTVLPWQRGNRAISLGRIRHEADSAAIDNDKDLALDVVSRLKRLYHGRKDAAWGLQRLAEHERDILNAAELLRLSERTLVGPLDPVARVSLSD